MDNKIDDGYPLKGSVIARSSSCSSDPNAFSCANTAITTSDGASTTSGTTCVYQIGSSQDVSQDEYDFDTIYDDNLNSLGTTTGHLPKMCVDQACCSKGTIYDEDLGQCRIPTR